MKRLNHLFENNLSWATEHKKLDPEFFEELAKLQSPEYLWIGCADSRVPANQITGLAPGEVFVHRNIGNLVVHSDLNALSVIQFAVDVLKVKHIMVVGHYGCGGVKAALNEDRVGLVDNWLCHIKDTAEKHRTQLDALPNDTSEGSRCDRLCELNVLEQVRNISNTTVVRDAWDRGQQLALHGWIYSIRDGLLRDTGICSENADELATSYATATAPGQRTKLLHQR